MIIAKVPISTVRKENRLDAEHYTGNPTAEDQTIRQAEVTLKRARTSLANRKADKVAAELRRKRFGAEEL